MPVCDVGPDPARDEGDDSGGRGRGGMNDVMAGRPALSRKKSVMIGILVSLGLVAVSATVVVVIMEFGVDPVNPPVTTSTSGTDSIATSTSSTGKMRAAIKTSASTISSTMTTGMTVVRKNHLFTSC